MIPIFRKHNERGWFFFYMKNTWCLMAESKWPVIQWHDFSTAIYSKITMLYFDILFCIFTLHKTFQIHAGTDIHTHIHTQLSMTHRRCTPDGANVLILLFLNRKCEFLCNFFFSWYYKCIQKYFLIFIVWFSFSNCFWEIKINLLRSRKYFWKYYCLIFKLH